MTIRKTACIGGGVIGGAWAARFLLNGCDVALYDPHPEAKRIMGEVMANAEAAYANLSELQLPPKGKLTFASSISEAVNGAELIQESVPERLELKQKVLAEIDSSADPEALVGSSTSGLLPSDLQAKMKHPDRLFVAHPYNPVYLLPLVEIVGGKKTSLGSIERAHEAYSQFGMKPVTIRKEIDAFVGDRLLEAVWREALWLIKDDVTTVEELDDIIRYSFGMRWAQMGLFQTYRIAGGEAGMKHFLDQFGPSLQWPWTKLMDVPELDDDLINKIVFQSDAQNEGLSIRELERIRDENLVAMMQALKTQQGGKGWGAGALLKDYEGRLKRNAYRIFDAEKVQVALTNSWSIETARQWTAETPAAGQCNVTAALIQKLFGGEILKTPWSVETPHFYNMVDGQVYDFTSSQFAEPIHYADELSSFDEAKRGFSDDEFSRLDSLFIRNLDNV